MKKLNETLQTLTPREEKVIRLRYGIGVDRTHTIKEISKIMDLKIHQVRSLETKALKRLMCKTLEA